MGFSPHMSIKHQAIISAYKPGVTTLREVARMCGTDHHTVKRVLVSKGIKIFKGKRGPFTAEHRRKLSESAKGRRSFWEGKKHPKRMRYANMLSHLRFDVSLQWLEKFDDIDRLKFLNSCLRRSERYPSESAWYVGFIEKFYRDAKFISIYQKWLANSKCRWLRPTIDHVIPKSLGGTHDISNLQFLPWFENRAKCDMTAEQWEKFKSNISFYLT